MVFSLLMGLIRFWLIWGCVLCEILRILLNQEDILLGSVLQRVVRIASLWSAWCLSPLKRLRKSSILFPLFHNFLSLATNMQMTVRPRLTNRSSGSFLFFFQNCFFFVQSESLWLCSYFLCWVFDFNSFLVVKMTVWNTLFRMCTMPCLPTLIGTTLRWRVLPSKLVKLNHSIFIFYNNNS